MTNTKGWQVGDCRSITHTFTLEELQAFATLTGDTNPLHTNSAFANRTAVGGQVVHGMLAASFVSTLIGVHIPGAGALWNSFQIDWRKMIRIGDTLRFDAKVTAIQISTNTLDLEIIGVHIASEKVYLEGKARVMMIEQEQKEDVFPFSGTRVLVTGASGEVGAAICRKLAEAGCTLVLWGRNEERLKQLSQSLGAQVAAVHVVDLLDVHQTQSRLSELLSEGEINGFVHAAAAPLYLQPFGDNANSIHLQEQLQVGVLAFQRIAQAITSNMRNGGFIIAVLSQAILDMPPSKMSSYVAAKMAIWGLVRALAVELGPQGIRCNAVSPNMIETPYVKDISVRVKQVEAASNPLRRLCHVDDVANAVAFLAGPQAAYINGINLPVTGGARMP